MRSYFNMFTIGFPQYPSPYFSISIIISLRRRFQSVVITSERGTGHHILFSSLLFVSFELFNHITIFCPYLHFLPLLLQCLRGNPFGFKFCPDLSWTLDVSRLVPLGLLSLFPKLNKFKVAWGHMVFCVASCISISSPKAILTESLKRIKWNRGMPLEDPRTSSITINLYH